jgi:hypothetical protein
VRPEIQAVAPNLRTVCAWCFPGSNEPGVTHGICEDHKREVLLGMHLEQRATHSLFPKEEKP